MVQEEYIPRSMYIRDLELIEHSKNLWAFPGGVYRATQELERLARKNNWFFKIYENSLELAHELINEL